MYVRRALRARFVWSSYAMRRAAASCIARLPAQAQITFGTSGNRSAKSGGPKSTANTGRRAARAAATAAATRFGVSA